MTQVKKVIVKIKGKLNIKKIIFEIFKLLKA